MKNVFSSWNRWAGRILMLGALLLSGCHKPYDDTEIVNRLNNLEQRVQKLEEDFKTQANTLKALTDLQSTVDQLVEDVAGNAGDISDNAEAIADLLEALGNLTGNSTLSIEEIKNILDNLQQGLEGLGGDVEGLKEKDRLLQEALDALGLTIKDFKYDEATGKVTVTLSNGAAFDIMTRDNSADAVRVMLGEDGQYYWAIGEDFLLVDGKKVPVSVVPQVKIDPDTREVSISVDGGNTWIATGVIDEEVAPALFSGVRADDKYVYFTLADGTELKISLSKDAADVVLSYDKLYIGYGKTETVAVEMTNVEKFMIVKPEGWRASITEGILSITAPAEGVGEAEGLIQIFTVNAEGHSDIFEIQVVAGMPVEVVLHSNGTFDITAADADVAYLYGVALVDDDEVTLNSIYKENTAELTAENIKTGDVKGASIAEALGIESFMPNVEYTVWVIALNKNAEGYSAKPQDSMIAEDYVLPEIKIEFSEETSKDAKLKITARGTTGELLYYIQGFGYNVADKSEAQVTAQTNAMISSTTSTSDVLPEGGYEGSFLDFMYAYDGKTKALNVGQSYFVGVIPADNKAKEAVMYAVVTLKGYTLGTTTADVTVNLTEQTYNSLKGTITANPGSKFRYATSLMTAADYEKIKDDNAALLKKAVGNALPTGEKTSANFSGTSLVPNSKYYLIIYAYDEENIGKMAVQELQTLGIAYNEAMSLELAVKYTGVRYVEAQIIVTGGNVKSIRYGYMKKADFEKNATLKGDFAIAEEYMVLNKTVGQRGNYNSANLAADNMYYIENMYFMEEQYLFVIAFDENDKPVHMKYVLVNTADAINNGFDATLAQPTVKNVYYIASSSGYSKDLSSWTNMNTVTDVTALDASNGMYWLDLDWGTVEMKRMWLCNDNDINNANKGLITGDAKHDAIEVLKKRYGTTGGSATGYDFYGRNTTTGVLTSASAKVRNTSEYKTLRNKTTDPISAKTLHLVWETKDGKYGYMTVVPEDFCPKAE